MIKWIPLTFYSYDSVLYCVFAKRLKTGMVKFKIKHVSSYLHCMYDSPNLDINKQWESLFT